MYSIASQIKISKSIPEKMPYYIPNDFFKNYDINFEKHLTLMNLQYILRDLYMKQYGFPFISKKWINPLVNYLKNKKVLEVMSGTGYLGSILKNKNINIICTDDFSWGYNNHYTNIENIDAIKAIKKYGKDIDIVIMSWPPYNSNIANKVTKKLHLINNSAKIIYIGEQKGGCTANDDFFNNIKVIKDKKFNKIRDNYQSYAHIKDNLYLVKYDS